MSAITESAARGAEFMDGLVPGWEDLIDLPSLAMEAGFSCILGQLYGEYLDGADVLDIGPYSQEALDLGFVASTGGEGDWYEPWTDLTAAWREEIVKRRLAKMPVAGVALNLPKEREEVMA